MKRTNQLVLAAAVAVAVLAPPTGSIRTAHADTVEARQSAEVFSAPGEQSWVVTRVRAGKTMTVLQKSGRWLKVRVNGRTGWIPRSVIASDEDDSRETRKTRKRPFVEGRSTRRGSRGSAPRDRVGADVVDEEFIDDEDEPPRRSKRDRDDEERSSRSRRDRDRDDIDDGDDDLDDEGDIGDDDEAQDEADSRSVVVVVADSTRLFAEPSRRSESVAKARSGAQLTVVERDGDWIRVENDSGEEGWVRASDVADGIGYRYKKKSYRVGGGLGYASLAQVFASNSADPLGNYKISSGAAVVALDTSMLYDYSKEYLLGFDLGFRYGRSSPGIRFVDPNTNDAVDIGYTTLDADAGASLGYKLSRKTGMAAYGRLGYHFGKMSINNVGDFTLNPAKLPTETLSGATIGAHLDVPMINAKWAGHAGVDALWPFAKRAQTAGLEDGDVSDTFALWANARVTYDWKPNLKANLGVSYVYSKTNWTGVAQGSMRDHGASAATRKDGSYVVLLGVFRPF
jgi:uncharacterized protein YgiM (DUF1202 family)